MEDDLQAITETARDLAYRQIDAQLQSSDNFDAKALGVLAFDGAAIAAILATRDVFGGWWWVPALLIAVSAGSAILTMQRSTWDLGPDPREFYESAVKGGVVAGSASKANVDLISELGGSKGSISKNQRVLQRKARYFFGSIGVALLAGTASAILVASTR